jgi:hypothetical protein
VELEFMPIWLQVHKIPEGYRKEKIVRKLVERVAGEIVEVEMKPAGSFCGDFVRVRVRHDVRTALTKHVSLVLSKQRSVFEVKYEKLGQFCFVCGQIGHDYKECGNGLFEEKDLKFSDRIYANQNGRGRGGSDRGNQRNEAPPMGSSGRGEGRAGRGRGAPGNGGRGLAPFYDWRVHPERRNTEQNKDLDDTTSSPNELDPKGDAIMSDVDVLARKRLALEQLQPAAIANASAPMLLDNKPSYEENVDLEDGSMKRLKRADGTSVSGTSAGSAASLEGDRQAQ